MMKKNAPAFLTALLLFSAAAAADPAAAPADADERDTLLQISIINALLEGRYDGIVSCGDLKKKGDFGIGTFDRLDGEMVFLDGAIYKVEADGSVSEQADSEKTPFASVTWFDEDVVFEAENIGSYEALRDAIDIRIGGDPNMFYAVRVDAEFEYVKTRSVPKQSKPYPKLAEVTKNQPEFEFENVKGSLAGFWCPAHAAALNVPGYHLHFLSQDRRAGGHLLECRTRRARVAIDVTPLFLLRLPATGLGGVSLEGGREAELKAVEQ